MQLQPASHIRYQTCVFKEIEWWLRPSNQTLLSVHVFLPPPVSEVVSPTTMNCNYRSIGPLQARYEVWYQYHNAFFTCLLQTLSFLSNLSATHKQSGYLIISFQAHPSACKYAIWVVLRATRSYPSSIEDRNFISNPQSLVNTIFSTIRKLYPIRTPFTAHAVVPLSRRNPYRSHV